MDKIIISPSPSPDMSKGSRTNLIRRGRGRLQYIAAISASLSAFSTGNVIGWTSQISPKLLDGTYGFPIDENQLGWIGSFVALGAACLALFIGYICDKIGRKTTKLLLVIPSSVGWALLAWATNVEMLYIGRFLTGMVAGAFMVTAPLYCNEISQNEVRGALGSLTQLMLSLGLLFDVIAGKFMSVKVYTICCFAVPLIFGGLFVFMPETPTFYLKKSNEKDAERVLMKLRDCNHDIDNEIFEIKRSLREEISGSIIKIIREAWKSISARRAFFISITLMLLRVFCGVDAITAYTSYIFLNATSNFDPELGPIIMMSVQFTFGLFQSLIIDRVGRRILLIISEAIISLSLLTVGLCFLLKNQEVIDPENYIIVDYLSLASLTIFCIGFSIGIAPIPLMLNAEINPQETRSLVASFATFLAWIFVFIVTKTFLIIEEGIGVEGAFLIYGALSVCGLIYIFVMVPETKGKTHAEIRMLLEKR